MSTFGEIVEPMSRSAWEDWDDINPDLITSDLCWQRDIEVPVEIETFLLFEGKYLSDCVKMQTHRKFEPINSVPEVNLQLFKTKTSNKYVCMIKDYNLILSSEIVELLKQYLIVSNDVIAIQTKSLREYQTTELVTQDCIARTVSTSTSPSKSLDINFPKLEQPNILAGVSAGVISLREHMDQSGTAVVCYMEHPEEYRVDELERLLEKLDLSQNAYSRPSTVLNSNLYI